MLEGDFICKFIHTFNKTVASLELKHLHQSGAKSKKLKMLGQFMAEELLLPKLLIFGKWVSICFKCCICLPVLIDLLKYLLLASVGDRVLS